jgi:hypothetical protein
MATLAQAKDDFGQGMRHAIDIGRIGFRDDGDLESSMCRCNALNLDSGCIAHACECRKAM